MPIGPPVPGIQLFQNLTLKIQGQGQGWGQSWKSQHGSNIQSTHMPFRSMSIGHPITALWLFQNLTLKIKGQGHGWGQGWKSQHGSNSPSTHIPFVPCQSGIPFLSKDFFKIWPWKSRVKVMGEVTVQSHNVCLTSYRLTSLLFHVNRASHSWVTTFSYRKISNIRRPKSQDSNVSPLSLQFSIHWSQVLSGEWRCSWSSADRRCSNYIWVINNLIAY